MFANRSRQQQPKKAKEKIILTPLKPEETFFSFFVFVFVFVFFCLRNRGSVATQKNRKNLIFANQSRKFSNPRLLGEVKFQTPTTCEIFLVLKILTCYFLVPRLSLLRSLPRLIRAAHS